MNKTTVLVIDDEAQIRKLLELTLKSQEMMVVLAEDGTTGLALAANHRPDVILLDLGLPDINGHEVLKSLRLWYENAIIILSVQDGEDDIVKALDEGASDYLTKPFRSFSWQPGIYTFARRISLPHILSHKGSGFSWNPSLRIGTGATNALRIYPPASLHHDIALDKGTGILTSFPSVTHFCLTLGADSPCAD